MAHSPHSISSASVEVIEDQYRRWLADPASVPADWQSFFAGFDLGLRRSTEAPPAGGDNSKSVGLFTLILYYRMLGHLVAKLDVLGDNLASHPLLELSANGLSDADLDTVFDVPQVAPMQRATLRDIVGLLRDTYCRSLGFEFMHIQNTTERRWMVDRVEPRRGRPDFDKASRRRALELVRLAEGFERYIHSNYLGQKRFSLEGGESLVPALDAMIERAADAHGVQAVIIGMAHRGRLNVLANIMDKSYELIFSEFEDNYVPDATQGDGDVKYHKGYTTDRTTQGGNAVHLTLTANPSHLEIVNPVVEGRARAKQALITRANGGERLGIGVTDNIPAHLVGIRRTDPAFPTPAARRAVLPILIHGDAAFTGQGPVWETLNLSQLEGYTTGGTVHVVINNQVGFTTAPEDARSTHYCTDIAKGIEAPVIHVNGDDVEAVLHAVELALDYRQEFGKDVVVDMYCYRRYGHNEGDEPNYTQPLMYEKIKAHPGVSTVYANSLVESGEMTREELSQLDADLNKELSAAQKAAKGVTTVDAKKRTKDQSFGGEWKGLANDYSHDPVETGVPYNTLLAHAERLAVTPAGFEPYPKLVKQLEERLERVRKNAAVDWGTAESLSFASLLAEGTPIRLSGQDCRRGTFSHRHSVLKDIRTNADYTPLNHLTDTQSRFEVFDSLLSEAAVMGFEYGVSLGDPRTLVIWEAQFGDFANGAQVVIDQFLASSETKWNRASGLALLLPHGYEGQGPEHSSARLERFLQLCADDNMQVCNLTTPAQYFHILRRQMKRNFRKPLVIMSPKSLLRHPDAVSPVEDLVSNRFQEVLRDTTDPAKARRVLLCTGKVYYDLLARRKDREDVAIVRVEQIHPFPAQQLKTVMAKYAKAREHYWVQEEPANMGAWTFVAPRLKETLGVEFGYIGRAAAPSPAVGSHSRHKMEQDQIVSQAVEAQELAASGAMV